MEPDRYGYFLFPPAHRRFSRPEALIINGHESRITSLEPSGFVSSYAIEILEGQKESLFYFDGQVIRGPVPDISERNHGHVAE